MLNYLFVNLFPTGATAFKANLFSAITSMLCLLVLSRSLILLGVRPFTTACTVAVFGFTYTFWSQSVIAEVYSLNRLFIAITLYYFIRWHLFGEYRHFLLACAFYSFSFGDHLIVVTLLPAIVFLVLVEGGLFHKAAHHYARDCLDSSRSTPIWLSVLEDICP